MKCKIGTWRPRTPSIIKVHTLFLFLIVVAISLAGCSSKTEPPSDWTYAKNSLSINYTAEAGLNAVDGRSHTLLLVFYQLNDVNSFNQLSSYEEGIDKLLAAQNFDASVMSVEKTFVEPGASGTLKYDRAQNAKHLGIVAGYYDLAPAKSVLLEDITYDSKRTGMLKLSKTTVINPLTIDIVLGKDGIRIEKNKK